MIKVESGKPIGYYNLIVVKELDAIIKSSYKERQVEVICPKCGKIFQTSLRRLTRKPTKDKKPVSCCQECSKKRNKKHLQEISKQNIIDMSKKKFGKLTPLYPLKERKARSVVWHCKCDCGRYKDVSQVDLQRGHIIQCNQCSSHGGFGSSKDITNQRFGKLIALHPTQKRKHNSVVWYCKCDCGNYCYKTVDSLSKGHSQSCGCLVSKGEELIQKILTIENINFKTQKIFEDCINPQTDKKLKFDFYLPDYNCCIEYDGEQHFRYSNTGWNNKEHFEKVQHRDEIKNQYCKNNNIKLIRIPYFDFKKIDKKYLLDKINS